MDDDEMLATYKCTNVRWAFGDLSFEVCIDTVMTPEAIESLATRGKRQIVAAARQLGICADTNDTED